MNDAQLLAKQHAEAGHHEHVMEQGDDGTDGEGHFVAHQQVDKDRDQRGEHGPHGLLGEFGTDHGTHGGNAGARHGVLVPFAGDRMLDHRSAEFFAADAQVFHAAGAFTLDVEAAEGFATILFESCEQVFEFLIGDVLVLGQRHVHAAAAAEVDAETCTALVSQRAKRDRRDDK